MGTNDISNIYGKTYIMEVDSKIKKGAKLKNYKRKICILFLIQHNIITKLLNLTQ